MRDVTPRRSHNLKLQHAHPQSIASRPSRPRRSMDIIGGKPRRPLVSISKAPPAISVEPTLLPLTPLVKRPEPKRNQRRSHRSSQLALVLMAVIVFVAGIGVSLWTWQTNRDAKTQIATISKKVDKGTSSNSGTGDVPSETKPPGISNYQVAPLLPKFIKIPKQSVNARIKPLGVTNSNELQAPTNIYDTGWYNASAKPGDPDTNGAMLIDGHVHGPSLPGVFANIKKLAIGDIVQVVRGDNKIFSYSVVKVQNYDAKSLNMAIALVAAQPGKAGLNLITCGGTYDHANSQYTQRTIVFTVLQS